MSATGSDYIQRKIHLLCLLVPYNRHSGLVEGCYKRTPIFFLTSLQALISHVILTYHVITLVTYCPSDAIVLVTSIVLLCFTFISFTYL